VRVELDKRQAEQLAAFIIENHDRIESGIWIDSTAGPRHGWFMTRVAARDDATVSRKLIAKGTTS
jgi:hypothetical protein